MKMETKHNLDSMNAGIEVVVNKTRKASKEKVPKALMSEKFANNKESNSHAYKFL